MKHLDAYGFPSADAHSKDTQEPWRARIMLPVKPIHPEIANSSPIGNSMSKMRKPAPYRRLSVVSYNVLADSNTVNVPLCPPSIMNWSRRREILLREILSIRADLLCLQDVDSYQQWWNPELAKSGYDSLFKQRTCTSGQHHEGVVIAWKRDVFDLFRSGEMDLNRLGEHEEDRSLAARAATSDNVALMALLRPWQNSGHPSGVCVVCTQLNEDRTEFGEKVRCLQACSLTRTVEAFNADFHLPVVVCGTMNCMPSSGTYEVLCKGIQAQDPAPPGRVGKPLVKPLSASCVLLRWAPPPDDGVALSPLVDRYQILGTPGGTKFIADDRKVVHEADCVVYDMVDAKSGKGRTIKNSLRAFVLTGLSSGIAYDFCVAAINALGQGPWSERSEPIRMPLLEGNSPDDKVLLSVASIKLLREREKAGISRKTEEKLADPRAYELRKLVKVTGLADVHQEKLHPFGSVSGFTPRFSDTSLNLDVATVCTDTGYPAIQSRSELKVTDNHCATTLSTSARVGNRSERLNICPTNSRCTSTMGGHIKDRPVLELHSMDCIAGAMSKISPASREQDCAADHDTLNSQRTCEHSTRCSDEECSTGRTGAPRFAALRISGEKSIHQKHSLGLRSAYMSYASGGEPLFTTLSENLSGTVDYIFFSSHSLLPEAVLSLPNMQDLVCEDISQTDLTPNAGRWKPSEWRGNSEAHDYAGEWSPYLRENSRRLKHRIPNATFPSNHLMLMANFQFSEPCCMSTWF